MFDDIIRSAKKYIYIHDIACESCGNRTRFNVENISGGYLFECPECGNRWSMKGKLTLRGRY